MNPRDLIIEKTGIKLKEPKSIQAQNQKTDKKKIKRVVQADNGCLIKFEVNSTPPAPINTPENIMPPSRISRITGYS